MWWESATQRGFRELQEEIRSFQAVTPAWATDFERECRQLIRELEQRMPGFFSFGNETLHLMRPKVERLRGLSVTLTEVESWREAAMEALERLRVAAERQPPHFHDRIKSWLDRQASGVNTVQSIRTPETARRAQEQLRGLVERVPGLVEGVEGVEQARELLDRIRHMQGGSFLPLEAMELEGRLPELEKRIGEGESRGIRADLEAPMQRAQAYIEEQSKPPPKVQGVEEVQDQIDGIQDWIDVLPEDQDRSDELERLQRAIRDPSSSRNADVIADLRRRSEWLMEQMCSSATTHRAALLEELLGKLKLMEEFFPLGGALLREAQQQQRLPVTSPVLHRHWMEVTVRLQKGFEDRLNELIAEGRLSSFFSKELEVQQKLLGELQAGLLSGEFRRGRERETAALGELVHAWDLPQIIGGLRLVQQIRQDRPGVRRLANQARDDYFGRYKQMEEESGRCMELATHLACTLPLFSLEGGRGESGELDGYLKEIVRLEAEVRRRYETLREPLLLRLEAVQEQIRTLCGWMGAETPPQSILSTEPDRWLSALLEQMQRKDVATKRFHEQWAQAALEAEGLRGWFAGLDYRQLPAEDRLACEALSADIHKMLSGGIGADLLMIRTMIGQLGVRRTELERQEREVQRRFERLQESLRRLRQQGLHTHCPTLTHRLSAMLNGIPAAPARWSVFHAQLVEAERVLERLERESSRRAAAELEAGLLRLQSAGGQSARAAEIKDLLERLAGYPADMPPSAMRAEVRALAQGA